MAGKKFIVVGIGEILWDVLGPGRRRLGGAPANFAYYAGKFGAESYPVSSIGKDPDGDEIISELKRSRLGTDYISRNSYPTGIVDVELDSLGKPSYIIRENAAWDHMKLTPELLALSGKADAVCFGTLGQRSGDSRLAIRKFVSSTRQECLRILDINFRQKYFDLDSVVKSLEMSEILKINDEELPVVAEMLSLSGGEDRIIQGLVERFDLETVVLTKGSNGARIVSRTEDISAAPSKMVKVVDTVGAGDAFTAAVAVGLLKKKPVKEILSKANELAGIVCSQSGAMVDMPDGICW